MIAAGLAAGCTFLLFLGLVAALIIVVVATVGTGDLREAAPGLVAVLVILGMMMGSTWEAAHAAGWLP